MTNFNSISDSLIILAAEPGRRYGPAGEAAINTHNLGRSFDSRVALEPALTA